MWIIAFDIAIAALGQLLGSLLAWLLGLQSRGQKPSEKQAAKIAKIFGQMDKCKATGGAMGVYAVED